MIKVKTFGEPLRPYKTKKELDELDRKVNAFFDENNVVRVFSVSDTATTDTTGATIGVVRVICYED